MNNANQPGGTTTTQPGQAEDVTLQPFTITDQQANELRQYRNEANSSRFGDNALAVLLVGRANWTPQQVQELLGMEASSVVRACRHWQQGGIGGIRGATPATYRG